VAVQATLCTPSPKTKELLLKLVFSTWVLLSVQVRLVTPDGSLAETFTSTPSLPLVAMLYQPVPAAASLGSVVMVITGGVARRHEALGQRPQLLLARRAFHVVAEIEDSGQDTFDVTIQHGGVHIESDGGDGPGSVSANAGELAQFGHRARQSPLVLSHDFLRRFVQISGARV